MTEEAFSGGMFHCNFFALLVPWLLFWVPIEREGRGIDRERCFGGWLYLGMLRELLEDMQGGCQHSHSNSKPGRGISTVHWDCKIYRSD